MAELFHADFQRHIKAISMLQQVSRQVLFNLPSGGGRCAWFEVITMYEDFLFFKSFKQR